MSVSVGIVFAGIVTGSMFACLYTRHRIWPVACVAITLTGLHMVGVL
ncbi:hypothetical protein [Thalassospira sp.]|nr:hypothetical protein [Thalassospira sp.]